jgi:hypothetical protein
MAQNEQYSTVSKQNRNGNEIITPNAQQWKKKLRVENKAQNQLNEITILLP